MTISLFQVILPGKSISGIILVIQVHFQGQTSIPRANPKIFFDYNFRALSLFFDVLFH